jgi:hypothetical protein
MVALILLDSGVTLSLFLSFPHISVCRFDVLFCLSNFIYKSQVVNLNQQLQETLSLVEIGMVFNSCSQGATKFL